MPAYRSRTSTHGRNMAGARALWRATGIKDGDKAGQVHEAVPAHGERADGNGDGVELGMDQHGGRILNVRRKSALARRRRQYFYGIKMRLSTD